MILEPYFDAILALTAGEQPLRVRADEEALQAITREVRELAALYPTGRYTAARSMCSYTHGHIHPDCPEEGCIIGLALQRCGISREYLERIERSGRGTGVRAVLLPVGFEVPALADRHVSWLYHVQYRQDDEASMAEAVASADHLLQKKESLL